MDPISPPPNILPITLYFLYPCFLHDDGGGVVSVGGCHQHGLGIGLMLVAHHTQLHTVNLEIDPHRKEEEVSGQLPLPGLCARSLARSHMTCLPQKKMNNL